MRIQTWLVIAAPLGALLVGCGGGPTQGPVTIVTQIDFSTEPFMGTFEVTEGAEVLGCSEGTFVDTPSRTAIHKLFTCVAGEKTGTFTFEFFPAGDPWNVVEATGEFSDLSGSGDFSLETNEAENSGVETFAGEMEYVP